MNIPAKLFCTLAAGILLSACGNSDNKPPPPEKTIYGTDIKALHKAQSVQKIINAQSKKQAREIEKQSEGKSDKPGSEGG